MKNLSIAFILSLSSLTVFAGGEMKEVCKDKLDKAGKVVIDKKTNKPAQQCKMIKVHKKLDGTAVPEKKK
jgi:hypothetical protein